MITQHLWISVFGREGNHPPHAHVIFKGKKIGAIDLNDFSIRNSRMDRELEKQAVNLIKKNKEELLSEWWIQNEK